MKLNIIKILLFCLFKTLEAQIIFEDFSDGDLSTNPTWKGNISVFTTIGNNTLRSNATAAGTYFLSTSINQISIKGKEWNFQIRQNLVSSATNFSRIYLASDNQNLTGSLTGYYLQLGEAGTADVVELFKQNGNIRTSLMRGTTLISTAFNYDIKITNSYTGVWELSMKSVTSINFNPIEASVLDNNNLMFSNIGILTTYTITNRLNFGFDNISIIELPNLIPPQISDLTTTGINSLQITFDKPLKENSVTTTGNYLLNNNLLPTNILFDNLQTINLTFSSTTFLGTNTLTINGISDIQNNLIDQNTVINFSFIPPIIPFFSKYKDLIISEIYADINPTVGIPAVEYLEIYNNTNSTILLQNYTLRDGTTNRIINYPVSILGNNYAIFTNGTSSKNLLESVFPNIHIITLSGFGLTDNGEAQKILNPQGNIIDSLTYSVNWHSNPIKKSGGWSLELVNFTNTCTGNWLSSIDLQGGTPGTQNSVFSTTLLGVAPKIDNYILSTNEINITFSEQVYPYTNASIISSNNLSITSYNFNDNKLNITFLNPLDSGIFYPIKIQNIKNCLQATLIDTTINIIISRKAKPNEVIISEIYADESPSNGLPEGEFVELFNTTNFVLDLSNFKLKDATTTSGGTIPNGTFIQPKSYLILSNTSKLNEYATFGNAVGVSSFPSLNSTGDEIYLLNTLGGIIDKVIYSDNWYKNNSKNSGGWSLEKINLLSTCSGSNAWTASNYVLGGTPGTQNSVFSTTLLGVAPKIDNYILSTNEINITFSEQVYPYTNASIISSNNLSITSYNFNDNKLNITFLNPLDSGIFYPIKIQNIKNCLQATLIDTTINIIISRKAKPNEVIISEIYPDESPSNGLPEGEFVELFNTTNFVLDLSNFKLKDATTTSGGTIPNGTFIQPKSYLILSNTSKLNEYATFGNAVGVSSFPSLNSTGDEIYLLNTLGGIIDKVIYSDNWYKNNSKNLGGWSLEKINLLSTCSGSNAWTASNYVLGGTPGTQNSVFSTTLLGVAPKIDNYILSTNEINITFSDQIYPYSNASIISSNNLSISSNNFNDNKLNITFSNPLDSGIFYPIKIQNIKNCLQATLIDTTINIIISRKAKPNEVIISEIYPDESPSNGLPEGEFVELFNTTNFVLDLSNFKLKDATTTSGGTIPNGTFIQPKSYLILSNTSKLNEYATFGNAVGVSSFPSLNATGDELILLNHELQLISKVVYSDSWYKDQVKQDGGYSLEKIDFENPCETAQNWSSSVNSKGGTPGKPNSIQANNPNLLPPQLMSCFALDSNSIELTFDDIIDDKSVNFTNFFVNNTLKINSAITNLYTISLKTTSNIYPKILNLITIVGIKDCATNQIDIPLIATFVLPEVAQNRDILINEILFNPFVGGSDFVEIYNNSNKNVNLKNWKIANYNSENKIINIKNITNNNFILKPKSYVVLTTDILNISNLYPKSIKENLKEVESLPTMADDKGSVVLLQSDSLVIDNFNYLDDFHYDLLEKKEGVSLERINFNFDTNLPDNWQSAAATIGYATPGFKNSQSFNSSDTPPELIKADPLVFSPNEDGFKDFTLLQCNLPENGYNISVHIYDYYGTKIKTLANNILSTQFQIFKWDGIEENGDKAKIGSYMVVLEGFNLLGSKIAYKTQVVVAGKF